MRRPDWFGQERPGPDHILSLLRKLRLDWLLHHFPPRLVRSLYVFVNGFITIGVLALLALVSRNPFVFPSLGPTAYLLFFSPLGKNVQPPKYYSGARYRTHLRLCGVRSHRRWSTTVRGAPRYLLAKNPGGGSLAFGDRRVHGPPGCQPSARWRNYANRFSRNYFETA